jgi:hypothetical protein
MVDELNIRSRLSAGDWSARELRAHERRGPRLFRDASALPGHRKHARLSFDHEDPPGLMVVAVVNPEEA